MQEEYLLALAISAAVSVLIVTLTQHNAQDYVFAGFFLICSTCFLKLNWLRGAVPQLIPLLLVNVGCALAEHAVMAAACQACGLNMVGSEEQQRHQAVNGNQIPHDSKATNCHAAPV